MRAGPAGRYPALCSATVVERTVDVRPRHRSACSHCGTGGSAHPWGSCADWGEMKRSFLIGVAALVTGGRCLVRGAAPAEGGGPTAPATIGGAGQYDFRVTEPSLPDLVGGNAATFALDPLGRHVHAAP